MSAKRRRGFTLLELLLASALAAGVLFTLWTLFSLFSRVFDKADKRAQIAQVARAIARQIAADLHHAIQDPLPQAPPAATDGGRVRHFGLWGTSDQLRVDVLQPTLELPNTTPVSDRAAIAGRSQQARVPELRTVYYTFYRSLEHVSDFSESSTNTPLTATTTEGNAQGEGAQRIPYGLLRRELDFETPEEQDGFAQDELDEQVSESELLTEANQDPWHIWQETLAKLEANEAWFPEVTSISFRYFDGQSWSSSWDSIRQKALPVAVEVTMELVCRDDLFRWQIKQQQFLQSQTPVGGGSEDMLLETNLPANNTPIAESSDTAGSLDSSETLVKPPQTYRFRFVVTLPTSPIRRMPRTQPTQRVRPQIVRPVRPVRPRPIVRPTPAPQPRPTTTHEWMRKNP